MLLVMAKGEYDLRNCGEEKKLADICKSAHCIFHASILPRLCSVWEPLQSGRAAIRGKDGCIEKDMIVFTQNSVGLNFDCPS
jgi:hypothetical protein